MGSEMCIRDRPSEVVAAADAGKLQVQVRAHGQPVDCTVDVKAGPEDALTGRGGAFELKLSEPLRGIAPGQAAVLYHADPAGDYVLGSGTIIATC